MDTQEIYYCYSNKLHHFLLGLGERYISVSVNKNTNAKYWTFNKSKQLDEKIELYNSLKYKYK